MDANPYAAPKAVDAPEGEAGALVRVGFGARFGASLIDGVVLMILSAVLTGFIASLFPGFVGDMLGRQQAKLDPKVAAQMPAMVTFMQWMVRWQIAIVFVGLLYACFEGLFGRALGKLLLGIRIADARGHRAAVPRLLARMAVKNCGSLLSVVAVIVGSHVFLQISGGVGWIIAFGCLLVLGKKRQALHDLAAKTAVYRNSDLATR
jgi:uncharacterized RDD family membrane protein YckC